MNSRILKVTLVICLYVIVQAKAIQEESQIVQFDINRDAFESFPFENDHDAVDNFFADVEEPNHNVNNNQPSDDTNPSKMFIQPKNSLLLKALDQQTSPEVVDNQDDKSETIGKKQPNEPFQTENVPEKTEEHDNHSEQSGDKPSGLDHQFSADQILVQDEDSDSQQGIVSEDMTKVPKEENEAPMEENTAPEEMTIEPQNVPSKEVNKVLKEMDEAPMKEEKEAPMNEENEAPIKEITDPVEMTIGSEDVIKTSKEVNNDLEKVSKDSKEVADAPKEVSEAPKELAKAPIEVNPFPKEESKTTKELSTDDQITSVHKSLEETEPHKEISFINKSLIEKIEDLDNFEDKLLQNKFITYVSLASLFCIVAYLLYQRKHDKTSRNQGRKRYRRLEDDEESLFSNKWD